MTPRFRSIQWPPATCSQRISLASIVCVSLVLLAHPASALVIDNFEHGPFDLMAPPGGSVSSVQSGIPPFHCIASQREVRLYSLGSDPAGAQLHMVAVNDEIATVMPAGGGGRLELRYRPTAPVDITGGGVLMKIVAQVTVAVSGGATLEVRLEDAAGVSDVESVPIVAPGPFFEIPLSAYAANLDKTAIVHVQVTLSAPVQGDYHLADLRMAKAHSTPLAYDAPAGAVAGPPYPTAPLDYGVDILPPDLDEPHIGIQNLRLVLRSATECDQPPDPCDELPIGMMGADAGDGAKRIPGVPGVEMLQADHGDHGFTAETYLVWDGAAGAPTPDDGVFDLCVQLLQDGVYTPALLGPPTVIQVPGSFAISYRVAHRDRAGFVRAITDQRMVMDAAEGINLLGLDVSTSDICPLEPLTGDGFRVQFTMEFAPVMSDPCTVAVATWTGDRIGESSVSVSEPAQGRARRLWAQPSVMRSATQFRLDVALERTSWLVIHDVQGRALGRLEIPRGASSVAWDGRDEHGALVPSGVYLARLLDGGTGPAARVVRLD